MHKILMIILLSFLACVQDRKPQKTSTEPPTDSLPVTVVEEDTLPVLNAPEPRPEYRQGAVVESIAWQEIAQGFEYAEVPAPLICNIADSRISLLRIDPEQYGLMLISAGQGDGFGRTAREWAKEKGLIAAFNAGMFMHDGVTNVGIMIEGDYVNNGRLNPKYNTIAAFNPKTNGIPLFQLLDLECEPWIEWKDKYRSYTQSLRMISCRRKNVWSKQSKYWSMVSVASDQQGRVLFCFTRSPYSVHSFNQMLLQLPLQVERMMYLEGGPETSFYVNYQEVEIAKMGSYETGFNENDRNDQFWAIPNIIAVVEKE